MRVQTVIKIFAGSLVVAIMTFTGLLAYHVNTKPLGGWFSRLIPEPGSLNTHQDAVEFASRLEASQIPKTEPGEQAFHQASELLELGRMAEAREKLTTIFNVFPNSATAGTARRIVSEMNLDAILGNSSMADKKIHVVESGDSYLAIAGKYQTTVDFMIHLNSMLELKGIQPGDELIVMPLEFRVLIEPRRQTLSLWRGETFVSEYQALSMVGVPTKPKQTEVIRKIAEIDSRSIPSHSELYRGANKILQLGSPALQIRGWSGSDTTEMPHGVLLKPQDMEEVALLTRPGSKVEIR